MMNDVIPTIREKPARKFLDTESLLQHCRDVYSLSASRTTIYREQRAGRLNPRRVCGRLLFSIAEVQKWIEGEDMGEQR
jgi:hypothetical protein